VPELLRVVQKEREEPDQNRGFRLHLWASYPTPRSLGRRLAPGAKKLARRVHPSDRYAP
jgi:hypothetical protein